MTFNDENKSKLFVTSPRPEPRLFIIVFVGGRQLAALHRPLAPPHAAQLQIYLYKLKLTRLIYAFIPCRIPRLPTFSRRPTPPNPSQSLPPSTTLALILTKLFLHHASYVLSRKKNTAWNTVEWNEGWMKHKNIFLK